MKIELLTKILLIIFFQVLLTSGSVAQIFVGGEEVNDAREKINQLKEGALIIPLIKQSKKIETLREMTEVRDISQKKRGKIKKMLKEELAMQDEFNMAIIRHFSSKFEFSKIYFVEDKQLKSFDPHKTTFINAESLKLDTLIQYVEKNYFILKYYKASGIATSPDEVRFFYLSDAEGKLLQRPFPMSPDRKSTYRMRLKDLLNISPNTNELIQSLVVKLNDNLFRYHRR